ncbi:MAG: leucyl/phenylalanyl-tRNA--protein transferase [Gammaproteobacteria bacterium]|nr:leucyl/phenylalanyl-tRNA--protein transferase [Gammaproteobacteria bacterium]
MTGVHWITHQHPPDAFPDVRDALRDPDGLLAIGGDLSMQRLLCAYKRGIFPWYSLGQPVLWWSPDPRAVLFPEDLKISRSLRKSIRRAGWRFSLDEDFAGVMERCAETPRPGQDGTWISADMVAAYSALHEAGYAHSVEVWDGDEMVGGLYGVAIGKVFFGESMFSHATDASKAALAALVRQLQAWDFALIDCQVTNPHLERLGSRNLPREEFLGLLREHTRAPQPGQWTMELSRLGLDRFDPAVTGLQA